MSGLLGRLRKALKAHGRSDTYVRTRVTRKELSILLDAAERVFGKEEALALLREEGVSAGEVLAMFGLAKPVAPPLSLDDALRSIRASDIQLGPLDP